MFRFFKRKEMPSKQSKLLEKLTSKKEALLQEIKEKHKETVSWTRKKGITLEELGPQGARGVAAGIAAGAILLSPGIASHKDVAAKNIQRELKPGEIQATLIAKKDISDEVKIVLSQTDLKNEAEVTKRLSETLKIPVRAELEGIRLNTNIGIIGYESHLTRYPGENIFTHFESKVDADRYSHAAMAGGPGAWGYLASSRQALTQKDIERERYYLVVQTFASPNWGTPAVKQWFRHRKMVVINPRNGVVVVGAIEDAGPEKSTGRSFGGSPEVMEELGFGGGGSRVLMYFVDDPEDKITLGPYAL